MVACLLRQMATRVFIVAISVLSVAAQAQNARFVGQVTDAQNAAIANASVEVTNQETGSQVHTVTDATGTYSVPYLAAGRYRVVVQAPGFDLSAHDVELGMGQAVSFNVQLSVAGSQTNVEVQASSELTQLHLDNSALSGTVTGKEVAGIQLNGRNFTQLIALAPGVSNQTQQDEAKVGPAGSVSFSVNGGRTEYNSFQIDGSEVLNVGINRDHTSLIVTPSIDAIQEIKILTSNYGAEYPSSGNGTTIVTTRSGSDRWHGSLYEFFRNEALNAKGYFDIGNRAPLYRRNDFGGTLGGPFEIPHLYDGRGKTFFFFSEEARLETSPTAYRQAVPSLAERGGDFSDVCPAVANGAATSFSRTQYPDCPDATLGDAHIGTTTTFNSNQLTYPTNNGVALNQNALAMLGAGIIPLPNATSGCDTTGSSCYLADVSLPTYWRQELLRVDHALSSKLQLGLHYIHDEWDQTTPVPQYAYTQNNLPTIHNRFYAPGESIAARLTAAISPTFLNEAVFSFTNSHITLADVAAPGVNLARPASLSGSCTTAGTQCPMTTIFDNNGAGIDGVPKIPGLAIAGSNAIYGGAGFAVDPAYTPWEHSNPTYSVSDNLTRQLGRHSLQFGAQWIDFQRNQTNGPIGAATGDTQGLLTFSNVKVQGATGNAFADFLYNQSNPNVPGGIGAISSFQQDSAQSRYRQRYQIVEPYLQDDYKVTPRLMVNLGLRLSLFGTFHEANNQAYNWEASAFSATEAGTVTVRSNVLTNSYDGSPITINQADPSAGLDPRIINGIVQCGVGGRPSGCMSGHLFNPAPRVGFAWDPTGSGKMAIRGGYGIFFEHGTADEANTGSLEGAAPIVLSMTQVNPSSWSGIGGGLAFPINVTAIPTKAVWSYVQQWSFSVEHELPGSALSSFAYVGSKGTHLTAVREINQLASLPSSQNPFGSNEPMKTRGENPTILLGNGQVADTGDCSTPSGGTTLAYSLTNGTVVQPGNPAYKNMLAACYAAGVSAPDGSTPSPNDIRSFAPGIGQIYSLENIANSSYNAFQATLRKVQGPVALGVAYTYSHSFDDASDRSDATFVDSFNIKGNRASSNFDQRQLLHISYIYDLPLIHWVDRLLHFADDDPENTTSNYPGHSYDPNEWPNSHLAKTLLGGWQLSGLTLFETGIPFTVVNNGSPTGIGVLDNAGVANGVGSGSYPDRSGISSHLTVPGGGTNAKSVGPLLLNPAAFVAPRGLTFGNAGRNDLNNPSRWNWDMALLRHFSLGEQLHAEFRAEAFNLFNTTQFRIYDPTLGNQAENTISCYGGDAAYYSAAGGDGTDCLTGSAFLHPVDAHRPRTIQFALKLNF